MSAVMLWQCAECQQYLPAAFAPCDCPNSSGDRFIVTPIGLVPSEPLGAGPLEAEKAVA